MTTIFDLPRDLTMEILSRVPLKAMREVRLTCKKLNTLSKTQSFAKLHIAREETTREEEGVSWRVVALDDTLSLMSVKDPSTEPKVEFARLNKQIKISKVFHCDGLLLCILKDNSKIVVWNPYWGQRRWIQARYTHQDMYLPEMYRYAIGYANVENTSSRNHKLLRFIDDYISPFKSLALGKRFVWYEIYDFDSDQWTTLDVPEDWYIKSYQFGVSLKGNTYFCCTRVDTKEEELDEGEDECDYHLICFDFTKECFGQLMRMPFSYGGYDFVNLSCVRGEKLAVLLTPNVNRYELEVWITTKIDPQEVTWSKFLTLNTMPDYPNSPRYFFIDEEKKIALGLDDAFDRSRYKLSIVGEVGYSKKLVLGNRRDKGRINGGQMCSYIPSSVEIKKATRGKRKRQCSEEQRRFDEKVSRLAQLFIPVKKKST